MKKLLALFATMTAIAFTTTARADLRDGLIAYWPFDGDAKDYSGNGNHGTMHGVSLTGDRHGNSDKAYYFGTGNFITIPNSSSLNNVKNAITIVAWIKLSEWHTTGQRWAALFSKGDYQYCFNLTPDSVDYRGRESWTEIAQEIKADFTGVSFLGSWVHVAVTFGSDKVCRAYVNGNLHKSLTCSSGSFPTSSQPLYIGKHPPWDMEYFIGAMDDAFLYGRALSSSEIKALYNGDLKVCTLSFDANGGDGNMAVQKALTGTQLALPANTFTNNGYLFQGWATLPDGPVVYSDGAEITVPEDMTLYAIWSRSMTLLPESADWSSGSITLRCEDDATSASTHKYSLEYCNESGEWVAIDGAKNIPATKGQNSAGQEVWIAKLTDPAFSSRLGGIPPVSYRATAENDRVSEPCLTRKKYAVCVAPGMFSDEPDSTQQPDYPQYAALFNECASRLSKFEKVYVLTGENAIYQKINDAFNELKNQGKIKPGDVCILCFMTHGGLVKKEGEYTTVTALSLHKGYYTEEQMANHVKLLNDAGESNPKGNGVAVVGFIQACQAGGITDNDRDYYCLPSSWCVNEVLKFGNTAWITATDNPKASAPHEMFVLYWLDYGWNKGWAGNSDNVLSCRELADYSKDRIDALYDGMIFGEDGERYNIRVGITDESGILGNVFIGERGSHVAQSQPSNPTVVPTGTASDTISVEVKNIQNADRTVLFKRRGDDATWETPYYWKGLSGTFTHNDTDVASSGRELPYYYQIRTLNGAGIGKSNVESAWRVHTESHKVTFMYELPQTVQSVHAGIEWELPYDSTLSEIWNNLEKSVADLGVNGFVHTGWFTEPKGRGSRITRDTRVFKPVTYYAAWTAMTQGWLDSHPATASAANGDIATAATMTAANGCRTVGECYALGINPEDPTDDLRITQFELQDGKPQLMLNHTADGSGKTFLPDVRVLGTTALGESPQWNDVTDIAAPDAAGYRFFKATVELP